MDSDTDSARTLLPHSTPHHHHHHHHQSQTHVLDTKPTLYPSTPTPTPLTHKPDPADLLMMYSGNGGRIVYPNTNTNNNNSTKPPYPPPFVGEAQTLLALQRKVDRLRRCLLALAAGVALGGLLLVGVAAALYGQVLHEVRQHAHQPKVGEQVSRILEREELCVPCQEVLLGPSDHERELLNVFTRRGGSRDGAGENCCVERPADLLRLLELYIEKRYRQEMAKGNIKIRHSSTHSHSGQHQDKPAAHLMGFPQRQDQNHAPGRQFPIGMWIHQEDLAFTHHVSYRHGRIVVPDDGLYYVYSQVAYLEVLPVPPSGDGSGIPINYGTESPSLSHYLYRYNIIYPNGGEEKLVQNSITKSSGPNKAFGEYTSYLGAVFHLRQGDEIFVKVSNLTMMARDPKSNYFGLFKV